MLINPYKIDRKNPMYYADHSEAEFASEAAWWQGVRALLREITQYMADADTLPPIEPKLTMTISKHAWNKIKKQVIETNLEDYGVEEAHNG